MAIFYGIDSNYASNLFSSFNTSNNRTDSFGGLTSLLTEYSSVKGGTYKKLLNAYYDKINNTENTSKDNKNSNTISTASDDTKTLSSIKNSSSELKESVSELTAKGSKSVFNKVSKKGEDGTYTEEYDTDAIYKAVKSFVDDYNSVIEATEKSNTKSIARNANSMITTTEAYEDTLSDLGITINDDFTLSIDEKKFKEADMTDVRSTFNGTTSYAYQVGVKASLVNMNAESEAAKSNTYTGTGNYSYNYSTGNLYDTLF